MLEQKTALATGSAAIAALALTVPASARGYACCPAPAASCLGTLGWGCLHDARAVGVQIAVDPACILYSALIGSRPAALLVSMLQRGVPQSVRYPILPDHRPLPVKARDLIRREILHIRHHSLFVPRDFDLSPYFRVMKPHLEFASDHHARSRAEAPPRPKA